jgi:preprotein translocase subunit SecG
MKMGLSVILILTSLVLIALILLHRGKGGGLSNLFGGGVSSSLGGSSVVEKNLDRFTIAIGLIWIASIISLGLLDKGWHHAQPEPEAPADSPGLDRLAGGASRYNNRRLQQLFQLAEAVGQQPHPHTQS